MNLDWSSLSMIVLGILIFTIGYFSKPTIIGEGKLSLNFNKMMKLIGVLWTIGGVLQYVNSFIIQYYLVLVSLFGCPAILPIFYYFGYMKNLKRIWLASLLVFVAYFVKEWLESGFDSVLFASGIAILVSGIGFLNKK